MVLFTLSVLLFGALASLDYARASGNSHFCSQDHEFGYPLWKGNKNPPSRWPELCQSGRAQSPINIKTKEVVRLMKTSNPDKRNQVDRQKQEVRAQADDITEDYTTVYIEPPHNDPDVGLEFIGFDNTVKDYILQNNGHALQLSLSEEEKNSMGILLDGEEYQAQQFHFHFGSEHRIDSRQFPLEMHIVHKSARGKLAVVAVLFKIASKTDNVLSALIMAAVAQVRNPSETSSFPGKPHFSMKQLLPQKSLKQSYFRYEGSLTTPPCTEGVQWVVLARKSHVSKWDLNKLKKKMERCQGKDQIGSRLAGNARPVQSLNGRSVKLYEN